MIFAIGGTAEGDISKVEPRLLCRRKCRLEREDTQIAPVRTNHATLARVSRY